MKVLRVRPKHYPEVIDIDCSLESLQKEVEGPIQAVYPWDDEVALICNEEGKLHDNCMEKLNRTLNGPYGIPIDIIVGTFLIVGLTEDDFGELLPEFVEKYEKMFHQPRKFVTYMESTISFTFSLLIILTPSVVQISGSLARLRVMRESNPPYSPC